MKYLIKYTNKNIYILKGGEISQKASALLHFCQTVKNENKNIEDDLRMYISNTETKGIEPESIEDLVNKYDQDGFFPIFYIITNPSLNDKNKIILINILKGHGANINAKENMSGYTSFHVATVISLNKVTDLTNYFHNLGADPGDKIREIIRDKGDSNEVFKKWGEKWYNTEIKQKIFDNEDFLGFLEPKLSLEQKLSLEHIKEAFENAKKLGRIDKMVAIINSNPNLLYDSTTEPIKVNLSIDDFEKILETKINDFEIV